MIFDQGFAQSVNIVHFEEVDSTQKYVQREFDTLPEDKLTIVSADFQTAGVGKGDRKWVATAGKSVLMTYAFRFPTACTDDFVNRSAKNVSHVLAVSAVKVLQAGTRLCGDTHTFELKWPNDIMCNKQKIGGILAEAKSGPSGRRLSGIIIGIGININKTKEEMANIVRPVWPATSLLAELDDAAGCPVFDVVAIREQLATVFFHDLKAFCTEGFAPRFLKQVDQLQILKGQSIAFSTDDRREGDRDPKKTFHGVFEGIGNESELMLRLADGRLEAMISGEIIPLELSTPSA